MCDPHVYHPDHHMHPRPCGLMDKASDFESEDCEFESRRGRSILAQSLSCNVTVLLDILGPVQKDFGYNEHLLILLIVKPNYRPQTKVWGR